jgi:hypothetical protein
VNDGPVRVELVGFGKWRYGCLWRWQRWWIGFGDGFFAAVNTKRKNKKIRMSIQSIQHITSVYPWNNKQPWPLFFFYLQLLNVGAFLLLGMNPRCWETTGTHTVLWQVIKHPRWTGNVVPDTVAGWVRPDTISWFGIPYSITRFGIPYSIAWFGIPYSIAWFGLPHSIAWFGIPYSIAWFGIPYSIAWFGIPYSIAWF